jgi:hypothetical protein
MTVQGQLSTTDLAEADRLISDLAALVDAGLVVAHEHVLGPARYGLTSGEYEPARVSEPLGEGCGWGP